MSDRVAFWADMKDPLRYLPRQLHRIRVVEPERNLEKRLALQGFQSGALLPRCGTALSNHEVAQGYKGEVKHTSAFVRFAVKGQGGYVHCGLDHHAPGHYPATWPCA